MTTWSDLPQCPAELHPPDGVMRCHLRLGHDGAHTHYTDDGTWLSFTDDEQPFIPADDPSRL